MRRALVKLNLNKQVPVLGLLLIGMLIRLAALDRFPSGINQDEAYSAYEAYCLLTDGMDSWGYPYPVYLTAWGSGMNALQSYLMLPFIRLFGLRLWVIRLPQAILACISLPTVYALLKRCFDRQTALIGLGFLAICPWQITMARWGLESNLAPSLLLLGLFFFIKGLDHPVYFLASASAYGLCLYSYATVWVVLPFMLFLCGLYGFYIRKLRISRWLIASIALLGLLAFPLLLFVAVNWGFLPEIVTPFFSISQMPHMRSGEVSFAHLYDHIYRLVKTFLLQRDDMVWNASHAFGLYYHLSLPFIALGGFLFFRRTLHSLHTRQFDASVLIFIWLLSGVLQGCMIDGNINRLNFLHMPLILCAIAGIDVVCRHWPRTRRLIFSSYALSFALFAGYYFTDYQNALAAPYDAGLEDALAYAQSQTDHEIVLSDSISYPKLLFYAPIEPQVFRDTAVWRGTPGAFMTLNSVSRYRFASDPVPSDSQVLILRADELNAPVPVNMHVEYFERIAVIHASDK